MVPRGLPRSYDSFGRRVDAGAGDGRGTGSRTEFHRHDGPQHDGGSRRMGSTRRCRSARHPRRGGHHPQWSLARVGRGTRTDGRLEYGAHNDAIYPCLEGVHDSGGLCVAAHPYAPYATGTFEYPLQGFDAVEVWDGLWQSDRSWNADNEAAFSDWGHTLADDVTTGSWRPAMGSSDTHLAGQLGTPQTVVRAEDLTASSILSGLRAGRSWIAESAGVDLSFNAVAGGTTAGIGEYMQTPGQPVVLQASVRGVPAGLITLHNHQGVLRRAALSPDRPTEPGSTAEVFACG